MPKTLTTPPERGPITRQLTPDAERKLWARYAKLARSKTLSKKAADELFEIRQTLGITDAEDDLLRFVLKCDADDTGLEHQLEIAFEKAQAADREHDRCRLEAVKAAREWNGKAEVANREGERHWADHSALYGRKLQADWRRGLFNRLFGENGYPADHRRHLSAAGPEVWNRAVDLGLTEKPLVACEPYPQAAKTKG